MYTFELLSPDTLYHYDTEVRERINHIPHMVTHWETGYIYHHMRYNFTGIGEAIELGPWLGASAAAALAGLSDNKKARNNKLYIYDKCTWEDYMTNCFSETQNQGLDKPNLSPGDDFEWFLRDNLRAWPNAEITKCNLVHMEWPNKPIEYLFIDAFKDEAITTVCINKLFPYLLPGAYILHQDYIFEGICNIWLHVSQYRLKDYMVPLYDTGTCSVVFKVSRSMPSEVCRGVANFSGLSDYEVRAALNYSKSLIVSNPGAMDVLYDNYIKAR